LVASLVLLILSSNLSFALEKQFGKTRHAVENAGPDDRHTLAISAEKSFKKKVNLKEASEWIDKSLEIAETPFNLELKGDYYNENQLPDKAIKYYVRAIISLKESNG